MFGDFSDNSAMTDAQRAIRDARKFKQIGAEIKQGVWLGLFLACIGCLILLFPQGLLSIAKASPTLNDKAAQYLQILAIGSTGD